MYTFLKEHPSYNKLVGSDFLIAEYKCPIETERFQVMNQLHFITYIISGKKDWITPERTHHVTAGDAIFVKKGVHTIHQYFEEDHCVLLFFMDDNFIRNFMTENHSTLANIPETILPDEQIFQLDVNENMKVLFHSVVNYLKMGPAIPKPLVEIKFKELFFNIVLNPKNSRLVHFFSSECQHTKSNFDHIMLRNFQHDLPLEDFAKLCGRSLSAFKRDFKNIYQQSPGKWLNEKRLEYARALLLSSDMNVNEICQESGFKNSSHFNKAFKDKYQFPPKQFRLQSKGVVQGT
jgi:AraC family transcriptional regulator, exoenzyme S synthesis regulatory protein ExsA